MKSRKLTIITISALLLAAATTVALSLVITEDAFAKSGRYGTGDTTSQAAALNNECLNPILDSNSIDNAVDVGNCGGTISQQDESGQASAPITLQNSNPTIELQRATTTQPPLLGDIATGSVRITSEIDCEDLEEGSSIVKCPDEVIFGIPIPIDGNSLVTSDPSGSIPIPTGPGESTLFLLTPQPIAVGGDATDEIEYADLSILVTNGGCSVQTTDELPDDPGTFRVAQITVPRGQVTCGLAITYTSV